MRINAGRRLQDGFKAHVVIEPDTGLITVAAVTKAAGSETSDGARCVELVAADTSIGDGPVEVLGDSAYGTGTMLAAVLTAGHVPVIKPKAVARPSRAGSRSMTSSSSTR
jgi:hypothetical protein